MLTDDEKAELACREYWITNELGYLLAGRSADASQPRDEMTNKAIEEVESAIITGSLPVIGGRDGAAEMFGWSKIRPADAVAWVLGKPKAWRFHKTFPKFDPGLFKTINKQDSSTERSEINLLKQVALLAILLAEKNGRYKRKEKPNASQIAEAIQELLDSMPDLNRLGVGKSSIRANITKGLSLLEQ